MRRLALLAAGALSACSGGGGTVTPTSVAVQQPAVTTPNVTIPGQSGVGSSVVVSVPIEQPTTAPTVVPTASPTVAPIVAPTVTPSPTATVAPSGAPPATPTGIPTLAPTPVPTLAPTPTPTPAPQRFVCSGQGNTVCTLPFQYNGSTITVITEFYDAGMLPGSRKRASIDTGRLQFDLSATASPFRLTLDMKPLDRSFDSFVPPYLIMGLPVANMTLGVSGLNPATYVCRATNDPNPAHGVIYNWGRVGCGEPFAPMTFTQGTVYHWDLH